MQKQPAFTALNMIHKALLMGQVLLAAVCTYLVYSKTVEPPAPEWEKMLQVIALILTFTSIYASFALFKKKLMQIREMQAGIKEKFEQYRAASILQWALIEGPAIFSIIGFFLTGNYAFLALMLAIIFLFVMTGPSKLKIQLQLQLSEADLEEL